MTSPVARSAAVEHLAEGRIISDAFVAEARNAISDLFVPRPLVYWADLLASATIGWGAFAIALHSDLATWTHSIAFLVAVFALFRAISFTHELVHLRRGAVPGFRIGWRLVCGIPLMVPHFLYRGVHLLHHRMAKYGTVSDGEYFPFVNRSPRQIVVHIAWNAVVPLFALMRFTVLGIISPLSPKIRDAVLCHASSMSLRIKFSRDLPTTSKVITAWRIEEVSCVLLATAFLVLVLTGVVSPWVLWHWYALMASIALANTIRALGGTHRYRSNESEIGFSGQILDSVNIEGRSVATLLACPVGLRFHALHHLFPTLPYHSLGEAHRRLLGGLPEGSPYRRCSVPGVCAGFVQVCRESRAFGSLAVTHSHSR